MDLNKKPVGGKYLCKKCSGIATKELAAELAYMQREQNIDDSKSSSTQ